jgi:putative hydrolase of the HAD superfamily
VLAVELLKGVVGQDGGPRLLGDSQQEGVTSTDRSGRRGHDLAGSLRRLEGGYFRGIDAVPEGRVDHHGDHVVWVLGYVLADRLVELGEAGKGTSLSSQIRAVDDHLARRHDSVESSSPRRLIDGTHRTTPARLPLTCRPVEGSIVPVRAVLWDFGGVITSSPFDAFAAYERDRGLPTGFIRTLNATNPDSNAWAALERGHVDQDTFAERFEQEARAAGATLDGHDVLEQLRTSRIRPEMVEAVRRCHERLKTALLTNNFVSAQPTRHPEGHDRVLSYFDVVLESSSTGYRKPDPHFYRMALGLLGVDPTEAVFLDDLGINLKPARAMGMRTVKVTEPERALDELEALVGFPLRPADVHPDFG